MSSSIAFVVDSGKASPRTQSLVSRSQTLNVRLSILSANFELAVERACGNEPNMPLLDSVPHVPARTPMFGGSRPFDVTVPIRELEQASVMSGSVCVFLRLQTQVAIGPV